ncbi:unnamed protein product [Closterium sp. Naga37s-1]|nr:unnamed protein product [Closterium sp. Naga37s-1]
MSEGLLSLLPEYQTASQYMPACLPHALLAQKISVVPFMRLVPRLPDVAKVKMRDTLIPKILKFLTIKRQPDASRAEFFVHAEAFAALVHLEFVSIQGAVTTILTLLRKPDNRCAAVTMLGKTVELCAPQLVAQGDPGKMEELRKAVLGLKEEAFRYDVNYVRGSLGWSDNPITTSPAPAATAAPPAVTPATAALSAGAAATAALAAAGSSPAPLSAPLPPSHAPLPPSQPPLPPSQLPFSPSQPPLPLSQPSRQSPMALTAPPPVNPPVPTHQMQTQGLGQVQGQGQGQAAMLVPLDSHHGHQHTILAGSGALLVPLDSYHGHQHTILAVGVDGSSGATWSAAMDGSLIMWGGDGKPRQSLLLGAHYVCGMDLLYSPSSLLLAAAPRDDMSEGQPASNPIAPCILQLTGDEGGGAGGVAGGGAGGGGGGGWQVTGRLDRNQTSVISCIKAIGIHPDMAFITAESMAPSDSSPASPRDRICCYDLTGAPFSSLHPVRQYTEHEDLITCLTVFPPNPNLFLSASRDATIRLWDRRTSNAVALLGSPFSSGRPQAHAGMVTTLDACPASYSGIRRHGRLPETLSFPDLSPHTPFPSPPALLGSPSSSGRPQAHAGMVTALDACPASVTVASGGMDGYLKLWDLRSLHSLGNSPPLGSLNLDESPILKLASSMLPGVVAVSTVRGLYLADLSGSVGPSGGGSVRLAGGFQDGRQPGRYHDIKWAHGQRLLFAGGDAMRVDVYGLQ